MATSVTYKDSQITSFANGTRVLKTAGKYMEDDVTIVTETGDASAITIVDEQDSHGGIIRHINAVTLTGDTITADKLLSGYTAHDGSGQAITGTYVPPSGGSGYTLTNIIPLQTAACTTNLMNDAYYAFINIISEPQTGHMYLVTMDGTEYVCEGYKSEYSTTLGRYTEGLGDIRIAGTYQEIVLSVPFYMAFEAGDNYYVVRGSGTHTIKVDEIVLLDDGTTLGTKTITANGTYDADDDSLDGYSSVTVNVSGGGGTVNLQARTGVVPTESSQTITADAGYDGLSSVQINAISSTYVGSNITSRSSSDLTASGATVTVPAGYYSSQATKSVSSMTLPTSAAASATSGYTSKATIGRSTSNQYINIPPGYNSTGAYYTISAVANGSATGPSSLSGTSATVSTGTNTLTLTKTGVTTTPTVSAGYVSSATASTATVTLTASVTTKAAATITPSTTNQTIASGTYLTGTQTISGDANLVGSNIISGKSIFGVSGTVVIQHYYTGSSAPSSSLGINGDIYLQTS